MGASDLPEPWLRGTLTDIPAIPRAVIHALQLAEEDILRWCSDLNDEDINAKPMGLPSLAFHLRHIPGSIERLLTYAEGHQLSREQMDALRAEDNPGGSKQTLFQELSSELKRAVERIRAVPFDSLTQARAVGRKQLPTSVAGLLIHVADHTQRHTGQVITTAKVLLATRKSSSRE